MPTLNYGNKADESTNHVEPQAWSPRHVVRSGIKQFRHTRSSPTIWNLLIIDAISRRAVLIGPAFCILFPRSDMEL
jgi:hypothetical protein